MMEVYGEEEMLGKWQKDGQETIIHEEWNKRVCLPLRQQLVVFDVLVPLEVYSSPFLQCYYRPSNWTLLSHKLSCSWGSKVAGVVISLRPLAQ
ncbi:hypothetical protein EYF80_036986 [Liparis tanakae]|uniref:Uncharacterized protein n=1 Tax=Liparis tanakae TaxID=230148 RepID=A0A4Z2GJA3_9TELE|nr:hypothetical protein EYF80_036986 [Liparis tanakae]